MTKLQHQLPGLKEPTDCGKDNCLKHTSGGKGNCKKEGVLYKGICLLCLEKGPSSELDREERVRMVVERKDYLLGRKHLWCLHKGSTTSDSPEEPNQTSRLCACQTSGGLPSRGGDKVEIQVRASQVLHQSHGQASRKVLLHVRTRGRHPNEFQAGPLQSSRSSSATQSTVGEEGILVDPVFPFFLKPLIVLR